MDMTPSVTPTRVLVVEDNPGDSMLIEEYLEDAGSNRFSIDHAATLAAAKQALEQNNFDIVLLDLSLPDSAGMDTVTAMRTAAPDIPIVVLTGLDDEKVGLQALQNDAQDYFIKGDLNTRALERTIRYATERKRQDNELKALALHDSLTGLANRHQFLEFLESSLARAKRHQRNLAILFLDLDHFKDVNDSLGHEAGDALLTRVAQRLTSCVRAVDLVSRFGGDEFGIVLEQIDQDSDAANVAQKIIDVLAQPFDIADQQIFIGCSIGVATYPLCGDDANELLKAADSAMYHAKDEGRNNYQFFAKKLQQKLLHRLRLERDLRDALERDALHLCYQPLVDVSLGAIVGMEALMRWDHAELGAITPGEFIPLAEKTNLIVSLGEWALDTGARQAQTWKNDLAADGQSRPPVAVAINVSIRQMGEGGFHQKLKRILTDTGLDPQYLDLELTESKVMENPEAVVAELDIIRKLGIDLAVDDFGTGHSSLSYLRRFPLRTLKIDRSFVSEIGKNRDAEEIVKTIISMGHNLGLRLIAEGVETGQQAAYLKSQNCDLMQGFYFSRPLTIDRATELLRDSVGIQEKVDAIS